MTFSFVGASSYLSGTSLMGEVLMEDQGNLEELLAAMRLGLLVELPAATCLLMRGSEVGVEPIKVYIPFFCSTPRVRRIDGEGIIIYAARPMTIGTWWGIEDVLSIESLPICSDVADLIREASGRAERFEYVELYTPPE